MAQFQLVPPTVKNTRTCGSNRDIVLPFCKLSSFIFSHFQSLNHLLMKKLLREKVNVRCKLDLQVINKQVILGSLHRCCKFPKQCSELIYSLHQKCEKITSKAAVLSANISVYILPSYFFFIGKHPINKFDRLIPRLQHLQINWGWDVPRTAASFKGPC